MVSKKGAQKVDKVEEEHVKMAEKSAKESEFCVVGGKSITANNRVFSEGEKVVLTDFVRPGMSVKEGADVMDNLLKKGYLKRV